MYIADSIVPVTEKDQQEPHVPWFLILVTAPFVVQSTLAGYESFVTLTFYYGSGLYPLLFMISSLVKSENSLMPSTEVASKLELCSSTYCKFF